MNILLLNKPIFTGSFYLNTDNVDKLREELKDKTRGCYEIENFDWEMREFAIYDNNGYLQQFGQEIDKIEKNNPNILTINMKNNILFTAGFVLTILGLVGIISKFNSQISSYIVLGLGLVLLILNYLNKPRRKF